MKRKACKPNPAPPLLCWDIYANWLNKKIGITSEEEEKPIRKKK